MCFILIKKIYQAYINITVKNIDLEPTVTPHSQTCARLQPIISTQHKYIAIGNILEYKINRNLWQCLSIAQNKLFYIFHLSFKASNSFWHTLNIENQK